MFLLFAFMIGAIAISFICSVMEAVLLCITPSYIATLQNSNPTLAKRVKALRAQIDRPLAAILTLNTIAHTAGAAAVGAQAAVVFGDAAVGIASAVMTLLVLVFSEIIPKTLGATYWRQLTAVVTSALAWLIPVLKPFVWLSEQLTKLLSSKKSESTYIRAEIEAMATLGTEAGELAEDESTIITNLLRFRSTTVDDVFTPRSVLFKVHKDMTVGEYLEQHGSESFSRILVTDKDEDDIIGFVMRNDIMLSFHRLGADYRIAKLTKPIYTVPETVALPTLFSSFIEKRLHICLIIDEYGDVQGIVTLEDMLESLLGINIVDERDKTVNMRQKAALMWQQRLATKSKLIDNFTTNSEPEQSVQALSNQKSSAHEASDKPSSSNATSKQNVPKT